MIVIRLWLEVFVIRAPMSGTTAPALACIVVGSRTGLVIEDLVEDEQFAGLFTGPGDFGPGYLDVAGCL